MKKILLGMAAAMTLLACNSNSDSCQNPFLSEWETPYGIPPFADIQVEDYIPAIQAGIEQQNKEIEAIVANADEPTFDNTIFPLELSSETLNKVEGVLYNICETDRTPELDSVI